MKHNAIKLAILPMSVCMCMHAVALEKLDDNSLAQVSGQDGIVITATMDEATINNVTWQDGLQGSISLGTPASITDPASATPISIKPITGNSNVTTTMTFNTGSNGASQPGMQATLGLGAAEIEVPNLSICAANGSGCTKLGALAVTNSGTQTQFTLITSNGLFNEAGTAQLKAVLDNLKVAIKQENGGQTNQLILGNMYANVTADGKLFVSGTKGLRFIGTINFEKKQFFDPATSANVEREGLELLVLHKAGTGGAGEQTLGKIALTGSLDGVDVSLRGVSGTVADLGFDNGTNGIAMRMSGDFYYNHSDPNDTKNLTIKLGDEAGMGLTGWKNITDAKSFDTGNVYINVMPSSAAVSQTLIENTRLTLTPAQLSAAQAAVSTGRTFAKEDGDSNTTPFGTAGTQFITKNGFVVDDTGQVIKEFSGLRNNANLGIVNSSGDHIKVSGTDSIIKDGLVAGDTYTANYGNGADGNNGVYRNLFLIDTNGNRINVNPGNNQAARANEGFYRAVCDDTGGPACTANANGTGATGNGRRGNRYVRVWVSQGDGKTVVAANQNNNTASNYILAPDGSGRVGTLNNLNQYQKAVNLNTGYRLSNDNLSGLSAQRFYINDNLEVHDGNGNIVLNRHQFNALGFLTETSSGDYVYEYNYTINAQNQLVITKKTDNSVVKVVQMVVVDSSAIQPVAAADFSMTNETIEGASGTQSAQSVSLNVREMSLQAYATDTEFFDKSTGTERTDLQNWSVAPVLYNVDANVLIFPKTLDSGVAGYTQSGEAIGYKLAATTKGSDGDATYAQTGATRTTGLLVTHDDANDATKTRYLGLRHMDSLIRAQGDIQITGDGLALTANDFLFAFRGELATGLMPTAGETFGLIDRLLITEGRIKGDLLAKIVPSTEGIGFDAKVMLANGASGTNSGMRLIMPQGGSSLNMGEITGTLKAVGSIDTVNMATNPTSAFEGALAVKADLTINPDNTVAEDMRIRNLGFNTTPITGTQDRFSSYQDQRLGEIALTKHNIYINTKIRGTN